MIRAAAPETAGRLVELYETLDRPEDAKKWRTEWAKYPHLISGPIP